MKSSHIIVIKETPSTINIRARVNEKYVENNIQLSVMLGYYWENDLPVIKNLLELIETVLKRTVNSIFPHENLYLKYDILTNNNDITKSTQLEINLKEIKADNTIFTIDGKIISLKEINKEIKSFDEKDTIFKEEIEKNIKTQKKVSFKEFVKAQKSK